MAEQTQQQWHRQLRREMEVDFRTRIRERIRDLKAEIRKAKASKRQTLAGVRKACKAVRDKHKAYIRQLRIDARLAINAERDRLALEDTERCRSDIARATGEAMAVLEPLEHALAEERGALRRDLGVARGRRARAAERPRQRGERQAESDDEVEGNIPPELVPVWRKVKRKIKAGPRSSRTEAFEQWVHDHSGDVARIQAEQMDRDIDALVAQEAEHHEQYQRVPGMTDEELLEAYDAMRAEEGDVPF